MHVGIRARRMYWANRLLHFTPVISGERALRREIWDQVPPDYKRNFQIEIALNFFAKQNGHRMGISKIGRASCRKECRPREAADNRQERTDRRSGMHQHHSTRDWI